MKQTSNLMRDAFSEHGCDWEGGPIPRLPILFDLWFEPAFCRHRNLTMNVSDDIRRGILSKH